MKHRANRVVISRNVVWRDVEGELVLFDEQTGRYHALNQSGSLIWRRIAAGLSADEIVEALAAAYEASPELLGDGVASFVEEAVGLGLLTETAAGDPA